MPIHVRTAVGVPIHVLWRHIWGLTRVTIRSHLMRRWVETWRWLPHHAIGRIVCVVRMWLTSLVYLLMGSGVMLLWWGGPSLLFLFY